MRDRRLEEERAAAAAAAAAVAVAAVVAVAAAEEEEDTRLNTKFLEDIPFLWNVRLTTTTTAPKRTLTPAKKLDSR